MTFGSKGMFSVVAAAFVLTTAPLARAQESSPGEGRSFWIETEAGAVWQTKNDVQIPSDTGTRFSLVPLGKEPALAGRIYLGYRLNSQHEIRALYAPLTLNLNGTFSEAVSFQNESFLPGVGTDAKYKFNSYRLTYRYVFRSDEAWVMRVGFTAKIRDAEIELVQGSKRASRANVGFVPLLHFSASYLWSPRLRLHFDVDALAAPQGRAEDIALLFGYRPYERTEFKAGYRTVEGGAAGSGGVYSFAWLHYAVASLNHNF